MKTNCSITLYNKYLDSQLREKWKKTIIKKTSSITGANWQGSKVSTISTAESLKGMLNMADSVNIFIPFLNDFSTKEYIEPKAWLELTEIDRDKYFTFQPLDFAVKGECSFEFIPTTNPITNLSKKYDDVVTIMSTIKNDNGSARMHHYQLGGK